MQGVTSGQNFCVQTHRPEKQLHHHIRLTVEVRLDSQWWLAFLPHWSGRSLILDSHWILHTSMQLFTDTSGHD